MQPGRVFNVYARGTEQISHEGANPDDLPEAEMPDEEDTCARKKSRLGRIRMR